MTDPSVKCPYCKQSARLVDSAKIYGVGTYYGQFWLCEACDAYCGVHKGTETPLGILANKELRGFRQKAHAAFDPLWKSVALRDCIPMQKAKGKGYKWLAEQMDYSREQCQIALFGVDECERVIEICQKYNKNPKAVGTTCRSCNADIIWLKTEKGKNIPVDLQSVESRDKVFDSKKHISHFATCPNADEHRKS